MRLEDQVAPLELARRMKAAGFPQETTSFYWCDYSKKGGGALVKAWGDSDVLADTARRTMAHLSESIDWYAAPTVAEIGEALPEGTYSSRVHSSLWDAQHGLRHASGATEAEARARLWLALNEKEPRP